MCKMSRNGLQSPEKRFFSSDFQLDRAAFFLSAPKVVIAVFLNIFSM